MGVLWAPLLKAGSCVDSDKEGDVKPEKFVLDDGSGGIDENVSAVNRLRFRRLVTGALRGSKILVTSSTISGASQFSF